MNYSRRQLEAFGETLGDSVTRLKPGGRIYGGGGSSAPSSQTVYQTNIPDYARPYVEDMLGRAAATADQAFNPYQQYLGERVAQFSPLQQQSYEAAQGIQPSAYIGQAGQMASNAVAAAQNAGQYTPATFSNTFNAPGAYQATNIRDLTMGPAQQTSTQSFTGEGTAGTYMNPYMQEVVAQQQRDAIRQSSIQQQANQAQAVGQGAFGGSRSAIVEAERQKNLGTQLGDIQATGSKAAFDAAMAQFNQEQGRSLQSQMANQQAGLTVGQQNLMAALDAQRMREQANQFGSGQAMTAAQLQAQYGLSAQQAAEASRQFGAGLGMQGAMAGLQGAGLLGTLGQQQFGQEMGIANLQNLYGQQQQQQVQNILNQQYQDFQNYQNYPYRQLGFMSDMLRGLPLTQQSQTIYGGQNQLAQLAGLGMAGYGMMRKEGGPVYSDDSGGIADILVSRMA